MSKASRERYRQKKEFFDYLRETSIPVDNYVNKFVNENFDNKNLKELVLSQYRFGNPQLRPAQIRLAYELAGGKNWKETIPACASIEVRDTGYYCLDNVLDKNANKQLVLLGGIFSSISNGMIGDLNSSFDLRIVARIYEELFDLDRNNSQGAIIDLSLNKPNVELYFEKAKGYNFWKNSLRIGAILSGVSEEDINLIGLIGENIGVGYIIANDTWDIGKDLEDFKYGKYTLPNIFAFEKMKGKDGKTLDSLFGKNNLTRKEKEVVRKIFVQNGIIEEGKRESQKYCDKGIQILRKNFPNSFVRRLLEFSTTMTQRNKYYDFLKKYDL